MIQTRIRELDGLRGIAAVGVALYHIHPRGTFWMWSFVDLFFVLSGFLITGILLRFERWDAVTVRNFWMRRILRIWPVYYLALFGVLILWFIWQYRHGQPFGWFSGFRESLVFLQYLVGDYADLPSGTNYLWWFGHSWSLAVEEQFYILWPLLIWALRGRLRFCAIALILFETIILWARLTSDWPRYLLFTRGDGLVMGSLVAVALHASSRDLVAPALREWGSKIGILGLLIGFGLLLPYFASGYLGAPATALSRVEFLPLFFALTYASVVVILLQRKLPSLNRWLATSPLVLLGSCSYAIYMFHLPIQKLLDQFYNAGLLQPRWLLEAIYWLLVLGLAAASRVLLERPLETLKSRFPLRLYRPPQPRGEALTPGARSA